MTQQSVDNCPFPPLIELLSIDSTNNYALSLLKQPRLTERQTELKHGSGIFAHEQYAGKGQRGKIWHSQKGENIHLSVVLEPQKISLEQQFYLIAIVSLAVRDFFDRYAHSDMVIKWPNDLYFDNRKAGGILIENIISGSKWKWAVAGIGLNINQVTFSESAGKKPVSLKQITGKSFNCLQLAEELRNEIMYQYEQQKPTHLTEQYNQHLYKKNESVLFEKDNKIFKGTVVSVTSEGRLCLNVDNDLHYFDFGELNWIMK